MASIKKKGDFWVVRYDAGYDGNGQRIQKSKGGFVRKKDAEEFANGVLDSINKGTYIKPQKLFLYEYLNKWLRVEKTNLSPTTYSGYNTNVKCHINPIIGGIRIQELRTIHIKDLYSELQEDRELTIDDKKRQFKALSPKSIIYVHKVLSKALEDAFKDGLINRNPAKTVTPPRASKYEAKFLTVAQIKDMLEKLYDDEMFMPIYLSVVLGLRRGEALGLKWSNIDFNNKVIKIRNNYVMASGKPTLLDNTKTATSTREIVVTDRIIRILKDHQRKQKKLQVQLGTKYHKSEFVCTWSDGKQFHPSHMSRAFKLRMKKLGLPEIRFHDLRHSNGALMIAQNVPMKGASERLGHSTIVVTNDFYGHVERSVQEQIAETIDKAIWDEY